MFIFGLKAHEIEALGKSPDYDPKKIFQGNEKIRRTIETLNTDLFCPGEPGLFKWIHERLLSTDDIYYHLADLESYVEMQQAAGRAFVRRADWARMAILNVARMGKFSSDRTIAEYARHIWHLEPA
jgi:starch phosphorylase